MSDPIRRLFDLHSREAARVQLDAWLEETEKGDKAQKLRFKIPHYVTRTFCGCRGGHYDAYATREQTGGPLLCPAGKVIGSQPAVTTRKKRKTR